MPNALEEAPSVSPLRSLVDWPARRWWFAGGAAVVIENDGLLIEDGLGSSIDLRRDKVSLLAATDLEIAAPGNNLVFRADTIDFERS